MFEIEIHFTSLKTFTVRRKDEVSARKLVEEITGNARESVWFDVEISGPSDSTKKVATINRSQITFFVVSAAQDAFALYV